MKLPGAPVQFIAGMLPGTITPTTGSHAGVPMLPDSALAKALSSFGPDVAAAAAASSFAPTMPGPREIGSLSQDGEEEVTRGSGRPILAPTLAVAAVSRGGRPSGAPARKRRRMPRQKPGASVQDYGTPPELVRAAAHRFGAITWDLAAHERNAVSDLWIGEQQNSLSVAWSELSHGVLWLNPPFGAITPWARKCAREAARGARILLLTPASVGANWFWDYVAPHALVLALTPRLTFVGETQPFPKDCILSAFGFGRRGFKRWRWTLDHSREDRAA